MIMPIPDFIEVQPWDSSILPLIWTRGELSHRPDFEPIQPVPFGMSESLPPKTPVEIDDGKFLVLFNKIGEGHQGLVYSILGSDKVCIKLCKNHTSQKQLRRELLFAHLFKSKGISYPEILAADGAGRWIIKAFWRNVHTGATLLAQNQRKLRKIHVNSLADYVQRFEKDDLCVDWMPSNVIFGTADCSTFETSLWHSLERGWTFSKCFLPFWLPHGVQESVLNGFPPYNIDLSLIQYLKDRWEIDPFYSIWRRSFGKFPILHSDWWNVVAPS
jgi:hypothetical protein